MNTKEAKRIAFGSDPCHTLPDYYKAWQWLHDNDVELSNVDKGYLDKLICDGMVKPKEGYSYNG